MTRKKSTNSSCRSMLYGISWCKRVARMQVGVGQEVEGLTEVVEELVEVEELAEVEEVVEEVEEELVRAAVELVEEEKVL
jgi:hypothetical protein